LLNTSALSLFAIEVLIFIVTLILRVRSPFLSSLAPCEDEPAHYGGEDQAFGLLALPLLSSLAPDGDELAHHGGCAQVLASVGEGLRLFLSPCLCLLAKSGVFLVPRVRCRVVLVFDLVGVTEAMAQFERSSNTSQGATTQLVQLTVLGEVFFDRFLCWLVVCFSTILV
jgi:hypothetical protein